MYHRIWRRIEAHVCAFVTDNVYNELGRQLKAKDCELSPERAIEIAKWIYTVKIGLPTANQAVSKTIILNESRQNPVNCLVYDFGVQASKTGRF